MFFDRPARQDLDAWVKAAAGASNGKEKEEKWDWNSLFPFFKKSVTFTAPPPAAVQKYGFTWDTSVYGSTTPIHSSFPAFLWADHHIVRDAWKGLNATELKECAGGHKAGLCWVPISQHPVTARRSHSGVGHYLAVNATRPNYDLLVKHQVVRVIWPKSTPGNKSGPPIVEVRSRADNKLFNVTAKAEVVISAGVFNTPAILQRSGIGGSSVLNQAGVKTVVDLPGVGSNLQDHSGAVVFWNYTKPLDLAPLPNQMADPAFLADAVAGFDETPARGPYTLANSNSAIFIPYQDIAGRQKTHDLVNKIKQSLKDGSAISSLPADYRNDPTMSAGYTHQLSILASLLGDDQTPSLESTFASGNNVRAINLHPLSRGTVRLNLTHPLELPVVNYGTGSNTLDFQVYVEHVRYLRRMVATPAMQKHSAVETSPGPTLQSDNELIEYVKDNINLSFMHPCCTAAMFPRQKGGVVSTDLKVYGTSGLRVVDMSVLPFLPSSHLSALAYAVGERAADMMVKEWSRP